tara:strand:- start:367 stop:534 length:168 start_codon:yes stop_codon:yes gene_type:complete
MESDELRLECLRLAVEFGSARTINDPVDLAQRYFEFVKPVDKPKAPRRKTVSQSD